MSTEETIVEETTVELPTRKVPKSFNDLLKPELVAAALAFGANEDGSAKEIKADLLELGVTWENYMEAFYPEEPVLEKVEEFTMPPATDIEDWIDEEVNEVSEVQTIDPRPQLAPQEKYLIKFKGENPYFERGRYKFSQAKPYAIMPADDAQAALTEEPEKFRQAFPAELQEFYS